MQLYRIFFKRIFDFTLALIAVILLSPVMLIIAVLIKIKLGSPIIFKQYRPGKNEKIFEMYKFRTMTDEKDKDGSMLSDEQRLTEFGRRLRSTSLDELPELFNIIKGDMSIVGPRPQLVRDMVFMTPEQRRRHEVRQGLTGLAQINGRNAIQWEKKLQYDIEYVQHISFVNDIRIILDTVKLVFHKEGVTTQGMATAEDFGDYLLRMEKVTLDEYDAKQVEARKILSLV